MKNLQPAAESLPPARLLPLWRFSLAELMLFITVAAMNFTCWAASPVFGFIVTFPMVLAWIRTRVANRVAIQHEGGALSFFQQLLEFFISCYLLLVAIFVFAVVVTVVAMFGTVCSIALATNFPGTEIVVVVLCFVALSVGLRFSYLILKDTWPTSTRNSWFAK